MKPITRIESTVTPPNIAADARLIEHVVPAGQTIRRPELLAPAGDWECVRAAVENGADAIYFGLDRFNARMRAHNFIEADLPRLMEFLHRRGVRGYVTFNTLVFTDELPEAERFLRTLIAAGVDAAIVQDVGICRLIRRLSPDFPIHASTQMTVTSVAGVEFARDLGCELVVLARECSLKEIGKIQETLMAATGVGGTSLPRPPKLEVFVHGALCVAYSGQCLTSESLGGRSANRGECAQACRLPYELIADGQTVPLGDRRYLLSPQDLASVELLPELSRVGIASLKIEGRLKSPEYVANITRIYREALDRLGTEDARCGMPNAGIMNPVSGIASASQGQGIPDAGFQTTDAGNPHSAFRDPHYEMEMAFSRGLHTGWFGGVNNQELVHARYPKKRGVYLGQISRVQPGRVTLRLVAPLKPGDGVVFDAGRPDEKEQGGRVYEVWSADAGAGRHKPGVGRPGSPGAEEVVLTFGHGDIDFQRIRAGDRLWKTSDPELERRIRQTFEGDRLRFQRPIEMEVHGRVGEPLTLIARDEAGHIAQAASAMGLVAAEKQPLAAERLADQLGRLGGTPFKLGRLVNRLQGDVMLPLSELNRLRREVVAELERQRTTPRCWRLNEGGSQESGIRTEKPAGGLAAASPPELIVLVRSLPQLDAALDCGVVTIYCELEDPKRYADAVRLARERRATAPSNQEPRTPNLFVAPPRITKPGEGWILRQVRACEADGYLVRNYDHLRFFDGCRRVGDYSLNVANPLTAEHFMSHFELERVTASLDLNNAQLEALLAGAPPGWFEITIHQHMPMFHMEHCLFCAFLTSGTDFTNCGRPCESRTVQLRDRVGALHPLKADAGCRNTVYNALAQTGAEYVSRFIALGARCFRIEFLDEPPDVVRRTIGMYRRLLAGEINGAQLWHELKLRHQLGVTRGSLDRDERPITVL